MRVAIVHELLHKLGGAERIVKIFADLFPEAPIYTLVYDEMKVGNMFPKERIRTSILQKYYRIIKRPQPLINKMPLAIELFDFTGFDLVISSSSAFAHGIITPLQTKHICYCHSPMRYAWDYTHEYRKEKSQGLLGGIKDFLISRSLLSIRQWDKVASDRPDLYIANSQEVQRRLRKYYQIESQVIYPAVDTERFALSAQKRDYYLIISALTPFKKIDLAIQVFNQIKKPLYIIGSGDQEEELKRMAGQNIKFLGRQDDQAVTQYLEKARGLIFPGEDDFGIVPVEAMAAGTPVLAYKKGGVLETIKEGVTGEFFTEQTVDSLLYGLNRLEKNEKSYNLRNLRIQAEKFSKTQFIKQWLKLIKQVMQ
jgi:glycosyltransferase involved in cell wall biosynthesis